MKCLWFSPFLIFLFLSCVSTSGGKIENKLQEPPNLYIAGLETIKSNQKSYFNIQNSSSNIDVYEEGKSFDAFGAMFIGDDLYVVGNESGTTNDEHYSRACYWKNGEKYILDPEGNNSRAVGIITIGNDVYICGTKIVLNEPIDYTKPYSYRQRIENSTYIIVVWKNGQEFTVKDYTFKLNADEEYYNFIREPWCIGIYNYRSNFIIVGSVNGKSVYWHNGQEYLISENGRINSAYINDENIYFAGYTNTGEEYIKKSHDGSETIEHRMVAKYWVNGKEIVLSEGNCDSTARDIFVYNNEVYIVGSESINNNYPLQGRYGQSSRGKIWKNDILYKDYPDDVISNVIRIEIFDNEIYLLEYIDGVCYVNVNNNRVKIDIKNGSCNILGPFELLIHDSDFYVISNMWYWFDENNVKLWINGEENKITSKTMLYSLDSLFVDNNTPYLLYSNSIPRLEMILNGVRIQNENTVECYTGTSTIETNISGLNMEARDIYILGSAVHIIGNDDNKGRYWLNGTGSELAFKPFKIFVTEDNVWMLGIEEKNIVIYKNNEKTELIKDIDVASVGGEIYQDGSDLIVILKYYDSQTRKRVFKIFKNRKEIDIYDFQSSGLYPLKVLYRNGTIYSCGTAGNGHYYYSIGNKSYNLKEKIHEMTINDFDVQENFVDFSKPAAVTLATNRTVYMVGAYNGFPALWKNKERQLLSDKESEAKLIVVK
jgi:hypothetical protein